MANRHQVRAEWHEYNDGIYFVTICSHEKRHIFGHIRNNEMYLSDMGNIVRNCIEDIPSHHADVEVCSYVVMPNHVHMIVVVGTRYIASTASTVSTVSSVVSDNIGCLKPPKQGETCTDFHHNSRLAVVVGSFKAAVTRSVNKLYGDVCNGRGGRDISRPYWQTRFHEHIIRNQDAFDKIKAYVECNVERWQSDCFNN